MRVESVGKAMGKHPDAKTTSSTLPSYRKPPVVETAISVQFDPVKALKNVHLYGFWSEIRDTYPDTEDQEPLEFRTELFGDRIHRGPRLPQIQFRPHASRVQARSSDGRSMVQLQNGRFVFNWRRTENSEYPRWSKTYPEFCVRYAKFVEYIRKQNLGEVVPNQWEVTYVNHLMKGRLWQSEMDWPALVPGILGGCRTVGAGPLEAVDCHVQLLLGERIARLYVDLKSAVLMSDITQELLVLTLTARGGVTKDCSVEEGLTLGHETIVKSFTDFTSPQAHELWERSQ